MSSTTTSETGGDGDVHDAILADYEDFTAGALSPARRAEIETHLAGCDACRRDFAALGEPSRALSGLHRVKAPALGEQVAATIHRRSGGRFFGRRTFGDRVPFEVIAIVGLILAAVAVWLIRSSTTGSVHERLDRRPAPTAPHAPGQVVPRPL